MLDRWNASALVVGLWCAGVGLLWGPVSADACSPPRPGINSLTVFPPTGTTGVPTNARINVRMYWIPGGPPSNLQVVFQIRAKGGAVVQHQERPLNVSRWRRRFLTFPSNLQPNTTYEVLTDLNASPCYFVGGTPACQTGSMRVISTFTTGAGVDTKAPQFNGLKSITPAANPSICGNSACCGPYHYHRFQMAWDPASDETAAATLLYNVYRASDLVNPVLELVPAASGAQVCSGGFFGQSWDSFAAQPGDYVVRAVDLAGNEDTNTTTQTLPNLCNPSEPNQETVTEPTQEPVQEVVTEPTTPDPDAGPPIEPTTETTTEPTQEPASEPRQPDEPTTPFETNDDAGPSTDTNTDAGTDAGTQELPSEGSVQGGCTCSTTSPNAGGLALLGLALLLLGWHRRRSKPAQR